MTHPGMLILQDGTELSGVLRGAPRCVSGELVFTTGMVGYPEALTDPSFRGQIVVFTYPLIGNYGVPAARPDPWGLPGGLESENVQAAGVVLANLSADAHHREASLTLETWLSNANVPVLTGVDTRRLTQHIRDRGACLAKLVTGSSDIEFADPNERNLVAEVSIAAPVTYGREGPRVVLVDTGTKASLIRLLLRAGARVLRVPWNHDFFREEFDGLFLSNGPGNPKMAERTIAHARRAIEDRVPTFGVCLGNQILALAAGADTYKLKFGHRSQNQPCVEIGTRRAFVTSQNHGYAVDGSTLPEGWREWFVNANDGTNEGIRHDWKPIRSVQFHPEATPGPTDSAELITRFVEMLR